MREMKDSGIAWIGEIPKNWDIQKIKYNFCIISGSTPSSSISNYWDGDVIWVTPADFKTDDHWVYKGKRNITQSGLKSCNTTIIPEGSIVFSKRAPIGSVVINKVPLCTNQGCLCCIHKEGGCTNFFYYTMSVFTEQFEIISAGTTFKEISLNSFSNFKVPIPSLEEQQKIADFLDAKCGEIDGILGDIEAQTETLEAYKRSVITEAVTKGLHPDAEMKDSGIAWIGEIPTDWGIIKVKYTSSIIRGGSPRPINEYLSESDDGYNWIRIGDTKKHSKYIEATKLKITKAGLSSTRLVEEDTLLLTNSMSYGEPYILKIKGCIHDGWLAFFDYKGIDKAFLYYVLLSSCTRTQFSISVSGSVVVNLNIEKVKNTYIALPSLTEQQEIADFLDVKCGEIDALIAGKKEQAETLRAYKKSLIFEYVTGKKEVPRYE